MASRSGDDEAGCSSPGISYELRARDLPSKRLLGKGLASIAYETEWNGERFTRKDFIGVPSGSFQKEASILVGLEDHKNVVKTHGWTVDKLSCSLVLEYVEEDLLDLLKKRKESQKRPASIASGSQSERNLLQKGKESLKRPAGIIFGRQSLRSHTIPFVADPLPCLPFAAFADDPFAAGLAFGRRSERNHTYPFELAEALDIVVQIAKGMEFLHAHHISHGDLKTKNILVTHTNDGDKKLLTVKVADFGLVRTKSKSISFVSRQARKLDMIQWQAPEILEGLLSEDNEETSSESDSDPEKDCAGPPRVIDGYAADVYSFAVTCSQILTGEDPYPIQNWKELGPKIVSGELRPSFPTGFSPLLKQLLELCWRKVPAERPTFSSIVELLDLLHDPDMMLPNPPPPRRGGFSFDNPIGTLKASLTDPADQEIMAAENGHDNGTEMEYMAAQPKLSKHHSRLALASFIRHGQPNVVRASFDKMEKMTWQQKISMILVAILWRSNKYLSFVGFLIEWTLNFFLLNGLFSFLYKLFHFKWGEVVIPQRDTENYLSLIGQLDRRSKLFVDTLESSKAKSTRADTEVFPCKIVGARSTADVCIMAAKVAYENKAVIEKAVVKDWKMYFVKFYNCWNEYQQMKNTQAFVCMDKAKDANAVVVAFRGTEPFNAYHWSTDLDFSWVKLEGLGGVHLGFLEALGLATRDSIVTLVKMRNNAITTKQQTAETEHEEAMASPTVPLSPHHKSKQEIINTMATSGLSEEVITDDAKLLAYDDITKQVAMLLHDNPKAKLFITGHSLGGALAALYATMLHYTGETEIASKIGAVYTFGQPRVGDSDFAVYASEHLAGRYFRVVYCNDVVPRFPFDNELFSFKHFGTCDYFNSVYDGFSLPEEPNPNFFGVARLVTMHLNAVWELVQGVVFIAAQHGDGFRENWLGTVARVAGVFLPGIASHNPCNYVNSIRLGPLPLAERVLGDIADFAQEIHLVQDNVKDIAYVVSSALPAVPGVGTLRFAAQKLRLS